MNTAPGFRITRFPPESSARTRRSAYQKTVVMKYLDNLLAWADQLFRRDTIESLDRLQADDHVR